MEEWTEMIPKSEITNKVTNVTVSYAERFGAFLAESKGVSAKEREKEKLTTSQLRKFFGEVKRQQMVGYNESNFVLLKPKLAYAVGRVNAENKIKYFYKVMSGAIDVVDKCDDKEKGFKNFIKIFEAIVAYHKKRETEIKQEEDEMKHENNSKNKGNKMFNNSKI